MKSRRDLFAAIACYWLVIVCLPAMCIGFAYLHGYPK